MTYNYMKTKINTYGKTLTNIEVSVSVFRVNKFDLENL